MQNKEGWQMYAKTGLLSKCCECCCKCKETTENCDTEVIIGILLLMALMVFTCVIVFKTNKMSK